MNINRREIIKAAVIGAVLGPTAWAAKPVVCPAVVCPPTPDPVYVMITAEAMEGNLDFTSITFRHLGLMAVGQILTMERKYDDGTCLQGRFRVTAVNKDTI